MCFISLLNAETNSTARHFLPLYLNGLSNYLPMKAIMCWILLLALEQPWALPKDCIANLSVSNSSQNIAKSPALKWAKMN